MELRQLRYFVKVSETLNFSEAAKALSVTQSTLSQQIKQLEDELGEPLLTRTSHSVASPKQAIPYSPMHGRHCTRRLSAPNVSMISTVSLPARST